MTITFVAALSAGAKPSIDSKDHAGEQLKIIPGGKHAIRPQSQPKQTKEVKEKETHYLAGGNEQ